MNRHDKVALSIVAAGVLALARVMLFVADSLADSLADSPDPGDPYSAQRVAEIYSGIVERCEATLIGVQDSRYPYDQFTGRRGTVAGFDWIEDEYDPTAQTEYVVTWHYAVPPWGAVQTVTYSGGVAVATSRYDELSQRISVLAADRVPTNYNALIIEGAGDEGVNGIYGGSMNGDEVLFDGYYRKHPHKIEPVEPGNPTNAIKNHIGEVLYIAAIPSSFVCSWVPASGDGPGPTSRFVSGYQTVTQVQAGVTNVWAITNRFSCYTNIIVSGAALFSDIVHTSLLAGVVTTNRARLTRALVSEMDAKAEALATVYLQDWLSEDGTFDEYFSRVDTNGHRPDTLPRGCLAAFFSRGAGGSIGLVANLQTNGWGAITNGLALWTHSPAIVQRWTLAEAYKASSVEFRPGTPLPSGTLPLLPPYTQVAYTGQPPVVLYAQGENTNGATAFTVTLTGKVTSTNHPLDGTLVDATETVSVTATGKTASAPLTQRWWRVDSVDVDPPTALGTGDTVSAAYTNAVGFYGGLPYRLYAADINERVRYIKSLRWTATRPWWENTNETFYLNTEATNSLHREDRDRAEWRFGGDAIHYKVVDTLCDGTPPCIPIYEDPPEVQPCESVWNLDRTYTADTAGHDPDLPPGEDGWTADTAGHSKYAPAVYANAQIVRITGVVTGSFSTNVGASDAMLVHYTGHSYTCPDCGETHYSYWGKNSGLRATSVFTRTVSVQTTDYDIRPRYGRQSVRWSVNLTRPLVQGNAEIYYRVVGGGMATSVWGVTHDGPRGSPALAANEDVWTWCFLTDFIFEPGHDDTPPQIASGGGNAVATNVYNRNAVLPDAAIKRAAVAAIGPGGTNAGVRIASGALAPSPEVVTGHVSGAWAETNAYGVANGTFTGDRWLWDNEAAVRDEQAVLKWEFRWK